MRIGLFGGTFDPIHTGHLILAEYCRVESELDEVWFLPSFKPPHKTQEITRFSARCEMVQLAIVGQPLFRLESIEETLPPPSYTAETLAELRRRHPSHNFSLIIGADSLAELVHWYQPHRVIEQAELLVVPRPGSELWTPSRLADALNVCESDFRIRFIPCPQIEIASREIRQRVAAGKSIRFLLPRSVEEFIRERKLYLRESI